MINRFSRRALARALLATTALVATPALGQQAPSGPPPIHSNVDGNGVDLVTGKFIYSMTEAVIGSGKGAIALKRIWSDGAFKDNWSQGVYVGSDGNTYADFGGSSSSFTSSGGTYTPRTADGSTLSGGGGSFTYIAADGTEIDYGSPGGIYPTQGFSCLSNTAVGQCAVPLLITKPDGTKFTINWDVVDGNLSQTSFYRFAGVTSSAGYGFTVNYATDSPGNLNTLYAPRTLWYKKAGVTFSNSANTCDSSCGSLAYSSASGITTITDALSRVWRFDLTSGSLGGIRRPGETIDSTTIAYSAGLVTSVTHDGVMTSYSRSVVGNTATTTITDALSHNSTAVADTSLDRITSFTDQLSRATSYQYDTSGRPTQITLPEGNYFQFGYDGRGNVTSTTAVAKSGSGLSNIVSSASFDSTCTNTKTCNQPNSTTDPKGNVTNYTYDSNHGGVLTITRPAPTSGAVRPQARYSYTQVTSASGDLVYMLTGTSACQTTSSCTSGSDESKSSTSYNSNLLGTSVSRGDGSGALTATDTFTFDPAGNLLTDDGPLSGTADTTRYRYDADRELAGVTSPDPDGAGALKNRAIRLTYRSDGQVSKKEIGTVNSQSDSDWALFSPLQTVDIGFDGNARPITSKLSASGTDYALTQTSYDSLGRLNCSAVRMNTAIYGSLPSDACTLGTQGSFGPDRISQTVYDNASQVTQLKVAVGTTDAATERTMTYSNNGKLASVLDGESNKTTYVYDGFDRISQTQYPNSTKGAGTSNSSDYEQLGYDANSNVISRRLRDGNSIGFTFDNLNRVTLKTLPNSEPAVTYGYDNLDRLTSASRTGNALSFTYDALSRKLTESGPQGTATSQYDLAGRRTQLTYPGSGLYVNYDYLVTGEASAIRENGATSGVGVLASYGYDNLGNRTSVTFGNGAAQAFTYDAVSRLASLTNDLSGTSNDLSATFSYNPASQITSNVRTGDTYAWTGHGNGSTSFTQNGLNQQITIGGSSAGWDSKGNLTSEPQTGKTYGYSSENLLTSASGGVTLAYDPQMRLYQVAGGTTTRFGYDGANAVADYDGSNTLQHRYVFGPGADRPIVQYDGSGTTNREFMGADERGSIVSLTDSSGNLVNVNRYDEYGKPQSTNTGKFQYTGQKWIGEINGYDYKARVYLPHLGIFAQIDPIGYAGSTNLYGYVGANPVNLSDPSGLCPKGEVDVMETGSRLPRCEPVDSGSSSAGSSSGSSGDNTYSGGPQNGEQRGCECVADSNAVAQASINAFHGYYSDGVWNSVGGMQLSSTMLSAAGLYNGIRTFGDNPSYGRPIARFFPNGRITSQGAGGFRGALEDLDYLAQLNGLTPPGPTGFASLPPEGWVWSFNPVSGYQILTNSATGLAFRANGSGVGSYNIDIPAGLRIGAPSLYSALPETVHYTGH